MKFELILNVTINLLIFHEVELLYDKEILFDTSKTICIGHCQGCNQTFLLFENINLKL